MGIELPSELADVAAKAGVRWPQADEDAMRAQAQAFRQAGTKLSAVATDADSTAHGALSAVSGSAGDAAKQHWDTFVAPDSGHFSATVRGCDAAADRLEHAAEQVGSAKVQIVGHLVNLAKNTDAAEQAAAAGHPTALLGVDTAIRGTAANVANVNHNLTKAINLDSGVDMRGVTPVANATPGLTSFVDHTAGGAVQAGTGVVDSATGVGQSAVHTGAATVDDVTGGAAAPVVDPVAHGAHATLGAADSGAGAVVGQTGRQLTGWGQGGAPGYPGHDGGVGEGVGLGVGQGGGIATPVGSVGPIGGGHGGQGGLLPGTGPSESTGPIQVPPVAAGGGVVGSGPVAGGGAVVAGGWGHGGATPVPAEPGVPTPPMGQTVQQSAAPVLDAPPAATAPPAAGFVPAPAAPSPIAAAPAAPTFGAPMPGTAPGTGLGSGFVGGLPAGGSGGAAGGAVPGGGWSAGSPAAPVQRYPGGSGGGGADVIGPVGAGAPGAGGITRRPMGARAGAAPGNPDLATDPGIGKVKPHGSGAPQDSGIALFLVHMFPIGHLPVASSRPTRQLPAPSRELDFAAGLRFPPNDHPRSDLVDTGLTDPARPIGSAPVPAPGLPASDPVVGALAEGYDPLGGENERDWDRRFLVRPAEEGSGVAAEYAWPPAELFPEGGCDAGEPVVLDEGTVLDRFGGPEGRVFAADGTPFTRRSLPPALLDAGYHRYRVLRPLPAWRTLSAAWFGQSGAGIRYRTTYPVADLIALGYLADEPTEKPIEKPAEETNP